MNARGLVRVNAVVISTLGITLAIPLVLPWLYGDGSWASFLFPGEAMILAGAAGVMATQASSNRALGYVSNRDVYLSATLAWMLAAVLSGVPRRDRRLQLQGCFHRLRSPARSCAKPSRTPNSAPPYMSVVDRCFVQLAPPFRT